MPSHRLAKGWLPLLAGLLAGCASAPAPDIHVAETPWAQASAIQAPWRTVSRWEPFHLPGKSRVTFAAARLDGRDALAATAESAASGIRHRVRVEVQDLDRLRFSWQVPELIAQADLASRDADDSPVRVVLAFEGDRSRFSARDAMLSELMRTLTGEELPYATLMYVWCNQRPVGSVVANPRTDRIRKLVVESGPARLNRWLDYERDIRADFERAFGEPPGTLIGVALMTDSDNTRTTARAWYGPVRLTSGTSHAPVP